MTDPCNPGRASHWACSLAAIVWSPLALASDTSLVSINTQGTASPSAISNLDASVSDNGRFVVFRSNSGSLVPSGPGGITQFHIYLRDLLLGQTIQVSPAQSANFPYQFPVLSADGSTVVFETANSVAPNDANGVIDVYAYDVATAVIDCISVDPNGVPSGGRIFAEGQSASRGVVSTTGNFVAFQSTASLDPADTNAHSDVYVRDRSLAYTRVESVTALGTAGNAASTAPVLSADSEYVVFTTAANDLAGGTTPGIYRKHRLTGAMKRVDVNALGQGFSGAVIRNYAVSGDGQHVAMTVTGANNNFNDASTFQDVFVNDLATQTISRVSLAGNGGSINGNSREPEISFDGRYVSFVCEGTNAIAFDLTGQGFGGADVILRDRATGRNSLISVSDTLAQGVLTSGGEFVVDHCMSSNAGSFALLTYQRLESSLDTQLSSDVYFRDRLGFANFKSGKPGGAGPIALSGVGSVQAGGSGTITIGNAPANAAGFLFIALENQAIVPTTGPFKGVRLVTQTPLLAIPISTSAAGGLSLPYVLPNVSFVPELDMQALLADPTATGGVAASEGLQMAF